MGSLGCLTVRIVAICVLLLGFVGCREGCLGFVLRLPVCFGFGCWLVLLVLLGCRVGSWGLVRHSIGRFGRWMLLVVSRGWLGSFGGLLFCRSCTDSFWCRGLVFQGCLPGSLGWLPMRCRCMVVRLCRAVSGSCRLVVVGCC